MPRRSPLLINNDIYHVFNRGVEKRKIFLTYRDYHHFLESLDHYRTNNIKFSRKGKMAIKPMNKMKLVEILCYCLMPTHFHLLLRQMSEGGISKFISKVSNSFTKYFNVKNDRVGPLFQGVFKAVRIESDEQLIHVSRYIHLNPLAGNIVTNLKKFEWSSYPIYISERQASLVSNREVLDHFSSKKDYERFVLNQVDYAKELELMKHQLFD